MLEKDCGNGVIWLKLHVLALFLCSLDVSMFIVTSVDAV